MDYDSLIFLFGQVVSKYLAAFCVVTVLCWSAWSYLMQNRWKQILRDSTVYFLTIAFLTVILALRPVQSDISLWTPISWFSFSMLLIMELLWISYMFEGLLLLVSHFSLRKAPKQRIHSSHANRLINTPYARK